MLENIYISILFVFKNEIYYINSETWHGTYKYRVKQITPFQIWLTHKLFWHHNFHVVVRVIVINSILSKYVSYFIQPYLEVEVDIGLNSLYSKWWKKRKKKIKSLKFIYILIIKQR